jgi:ribonuclease HII
MKEIRYIVGVDEAGRGPLAGPVAVGAVVISADFYQEYLNRQMLVKNRTKEYVSDKHRRTRFRIPIGKDSKKMSESERKFWFKELVKDKQEGKLDYRVALVSNNNIDQLGIVSAINLGLSDCLNKLEINPDECLILLDGGLSAPSIFHNQQTIIHGDEKEAVIGLASIAAKVIRDHRMIKFDKQYPIYQFAKHKGYGTKLHFSLIKQYGLSPIHRKSFLRKILASV